MYDTEELIRERTEYVKLADGTWRAEFPGTTLRIVVTAPTLEGARWDILRAFDARFFAMLCDDLGLRGENRPRPTFGNLRRSAAASAAAPESSRSADAERPRK